MKLLARITHLLDTFGPTLIAIALAGQAFAQVVPFQGSYAGSGSPTIAMSGHATHLGGFTGTAMITPTGPTTFVGVFLWQQPNGDMIWGTLDGQLTQPLGPGVFAYQEVVTVLGGTGRFAGASGTQVATGTTNFITTAFDGRFDGSLVLVPGAHH